MALMPEIGEGGYYLGWVIFTDRWTAVVLLDGASGDGGLMCLCPLGKGWDVHDGWKLRAATTTLHENKSRVGIISTMTRIYTY